MPPGSTISTNSVQYISRIERESSKTTRDGHDQHEAPSVIEQLVHHDRVARHVTENVLVQN